MQHEKQTYLCQKEKTKQLKLLIINYLLQINNSLVELNT